MSSASVGPSIVGGGGLSGDTTQGAAARGVGVELSWLCGGGMEGCDADSATGWGDDGGCNQYKGVRMLLRAAARWMGWLEYRDGESDDCAV